MDETPKIVVKTSIEFPMERIKNLLCCALEGGSNYWYTIEKFHEPTNLDEIKKTGEIFRHLDYPANPGGYLIVSDRVESNGRNMLKGKVDIKTMTKGLQIMADKYPRHFSSFLEDNEDAETGDVFLQCTVFGELVYG